ncbi:translocon-associated protein subunit beta [Arachis hypogaea]|nr:translocon-associated protein subunit beta [Arachis hypogaea]
MGYNRGRYGGCNCGGAMAGRNLHGENSGGFSAPHSKTTSFASSSKKSLSSSLFSHPCDPDFFTTLPSIAAAHLAARRAARRSARRAARLCSFITAAHHLFITAGSSNDEGTHRLTAVALIASLLVCSSLASSDVPLIVGHKKATLDRINSCAEMVSIAIDVYNQGTSTAYDVSLTDDGWPSDKFSVISNHGGILSHTFELETNTKGVFAGEPAVIKFRVPTKAALQALSTPILPLDVLADRPPEQKFEWAKRLLAKYGSLISVISIIVLFVYLGATPSKSSTKGSKKRH